MRTPYWCGLLFLLLIGCNRQDTDALSRIGRKMTAHARSNAEDFGAKLDLGFASRKEPSLQEKVHDRLRFENTLTEITVEVHVHDKEVELKGTVKTDLQRQRAVELAETTAGVDKVTNSLQIVEAAPNP